MDSTFPWLIAFGASQLAFTMIGVLPPHVWHSQLETVKTPAVGAMADASA